MIKIILYSLIIGAIGGGCIAAGAARMNYAPKIQSMGAFRTLGELNACAGDPAAHFSFGLGFFFNAAAASVAAVPITAIHIPDCLNSVLTVLKSAADETDFIFPKQLTYNFTFGYN